MTLAAVAFDPRQTIIGFFDGSKALSVLLCLRPSISQTHGKATLGHKETADTPLGPAALTSTEPNAGKTVATLLCKEHRRGDKGIQKRNPDAINTRQPKVDHTPAHCRRVGIETTAQGLTLI